LSTKIMGRRNEMKLNELHKRTLMELAPKIDLPGPEPETMPPEEEEGGEPESIPNFEGELPAPEPTGPGATESPQEVAGTDELGVKPAPEGKVNPNLQTQDLQPLTNTINQLDGMKSAIGDIIMGEEEPLKSKLVGLQDLISGIIEFVNTEILSGEPGVEPPGAEPLEAEPLETEPMGAEPMGAEPAGRTLQMPLPGAEPQALAASYVRNRKPLSERRE
jgi:hypothetical protein